MTDTRSGPRALRADAQRNRAKVIEAAREVVAREGAGASMRTVASAASVGLATVYRQFPTKEAMLDAIAAEQIEELSRRAEELASAPEAGEAFFAFFEEAVSGAAGQSDVVMEALAVTDASTSLPENDGRLVAATEALLARAQEAGRVRGDLSIGDLNVLLSAACVAAHRCRDDGERLARILSVFRHGLTTGP